MPETNQAKTDTTLARQVLEWYESLPAEEKIKALQDPDTAAVIRFARENPDIGSPLKDEPSTVNLTNEPPAAAPEPTTRVDTLTRRMLTALSGGLGGALEGFVSGGPSGALIGGGIGAGLGALLPHEQGPSENPLAYASDVYLPLGIGRASRLLGKFTKPLAENPSFLSRAALPIVRGAREAVAAGVPMTAEQKLEEILGLHPKTEGVNPLAFAIPGAIGAGAGVIQALPDTPSLAANKILDLFGLRKIGEVLRKGSLNDKLAVGKEDSDVVKAWDSLNEPIREFDEKLRDLQLNIIRTDEQIANLQAKMASTKAQKREELAQELAKQRDRKAKLMQEAADLKIEAIVNKFNLKQKLREAQIGISPFSGEPRHELVVDLDKLNQRLAEGSIDPDDAAAVINEARRGRISVRVDDNNNPIVLDSFKHIEDAADIDYLRILNESVLNFMESGDISQSKARALLARIAQQAKNLVTDASRAKSVEEFAERLKAIDVLRSQDLDNQIEQVRNRLEQALTTKPQIDQREITSLQEQLSALRTLRTSHQASLDELRVLGPEMLQKDPKLYELVRNSAGPGEFYRKLLDQNTPDELITQALRYISSKNPDLANEIRRDLIEQYFRNVFTAIESNQPHPVSDSKLFAMVRDIIPAGKDHEVFQNIRDFVRITNEYAHGGGFLPYVTYGARWTVRSLPTLFILAGTANFAPKLATLGVFAIVLSTPLIVEQIARKTVVGSQILRWLRDDAADPRRLSVYPALKRWILENGTPVSKENEKEIAPEFMVPEPPGAATGQAQPGPVQVPSGQTAMAQGLTPTGLP
jgi:hypothetical protein